MRVLVTGGTGYLGRAIVRALADRGHAPVLFARRAAAAGLPGDPIDGDVRDRVALAAAARRCEALCHTAALVRIWRPDPAEFDAVNVGGLENALAAARDAGLLKIVYTSSFLALPPAGRSTPLAANDYQRTKVAADLVARRAAETGAPLVRLYPGVIYGPGAMTAGNLVGRLLADHARGRLPGLIGPDRIWSFAWIDDIAAAHVAALERAPAGSTYQLGGENAPVLDAFRHAQAHGLGPLPRRLPYPLASLIGAAEELRARLTGREPLVTRGAVEIFRHDWPLESTDAARDLGYAVTPLDEGIARLMAELLPAEPSTN